MARQPEGVELSCSFCGSGHPHKLIAGPSIFICHECVAKTVEMARDATNFIPTTADLTQAVVGSQSFFVRLFLPQQQRPLPPACEFCGRSPHDLIQPPSVLGKRALICGECRRLCQDVIAERVQYR